MRKFEVVIFAAKDHYCTHTSFQRHSKNSLILMDNIILLVLRFCWVIAFDADVALMDKIDYELIEGYLNVVSN